MTQEVHPFRVKARLLRLLGDELIRDASLAVFELVKNAYDADATTCRVEVQDADDRAKARIVVQDDGSGMSLETIRDVWLVIGTDYRTDQRARRKKTPKFNRFPLGEKGLGRLAAHKLGAAITLISKQPGRQEVVVRIDWDQLEKAGEIGSVSIPVTTRKPEVFTGNTHGTRIEVSRLRETWDRARARKLVRATNSLCSPYHAPGDFKVALSITPDKGWLEGLLEPVEVRKIALYRASGVMEGSKLTYSYQFRPLKKMKGKLEARTVKDVEMPLARKRGRQAQEIDLNVVPQSRDPDKPLSIGPIEFEFFIFDLDTEVLRLAVEDVKGLKDYLRENGGIRIYRDGVRVFDFGEPGNDWLNLDGRRVNEPVGKISNRQMLGAIVLDAESSQALVEKSNREGFIENEAYETLKDAILFALTQVEAERRQDQKRVRAFYARRGPEKPVLEELAELKEELDRRGLLGDFEPKVKAIERQFEAFQDTMLRAAVPGLTFGTVIHEAEKLVAELVQVVHEDGDLQRIRILVDQLAGLIDGFGDLMRRTGTAEETARRLIEQAKFNSQFRFRAHGIRLVEGLSLGSPDFTVVCTRRLVVATLMNLIDNSIYWLDASGQKDKQIYLGTSLDLEGGPALIVADNGPGFQDEPSALIQPFFSRRPDGMGLGLYLADEIANRHGGRLLFPAPGDVKLSSNLSGAVVALQFQPRS